MKIDLNADLGEGVGNDTLLMPYVSSCNIACGIHAGDRETIRRTILLAIQNRVKIGAHPSFPDRKNFGRVDMELPPDELTSEIIEQVNVVKEIAEKEGGVLHHIKPHGALYTMAAVRQDIAKAVVKAIKKFDAKVFLYAPFGSVISSVSQEEGIKIKHEVFADRNYQEDLSLVSRSHENALLTDPHEIAAHVIRMITEHKVRTISGQDLPILTDTVCIHGDNPHAIEIVKVLSSKFKASGITIG